MRKVINKSPYAWGLCLIILVQCLCMVFWAGKKGGLYVDEFFTYENAHYAASSTPGRVKLLDAAPRNQWIELQDLRDLITVKTTESVLNDSPGQIIDHYINGYPYMVTLNMLLALTDGAFSIWIPIVFNVFLFALHQIVLYFLAKKLCNHEAGLLSVFLFGFSGMAISMTIYVRFYMFAILFTTLFTFLHVVLWENKNIGKSLALEILIVITLFFAYRDTTLAAIYGVGMMGAYALALLIKKRWIDFGVYVIPLAGGGLWYLYTRTSLIEAFFHPEKVKASGVGGAAMMSLLNNWDNLNGQTAIERSVDLLRAVGQYIFGKTILLIVWIILILTLVVLSHKKKSEDNRSRADRKWVYRAIIGSVCVYLIASVVLGYMGFIRYISLVYPEIVLIMILAVTYRRDEVGIEDIKIKKGILALEIGVVLAAAVFTAYIPRIEGLYPTDKAAIENVKDFSNIDSVILDFGGCVEDRVMYECAAFGNVGAKVNIADLDTLNNLQTDKDILVWQTCLVEIDTPQVLNEMGYGDVQLIAQTHESIIYKCRREE